MRRRREGERESGGKKRAKVSFDLFDGGCRTDRVAATRDCVYVAPQSFSSRYARSVISLAQAREEFGPEADITK